nr:hypothetical protein [uncultured Cohaesibacter sp.]
MAALSGLVTAQAVLRFGGRQQQVFLSPQYSAFRLLDCGRKRLFQHPIKSSLVQMTLADHQPNGSQVYLTNSQYSKALGTPIINLSRLKQQA